MAISHATKAMANSQYIKKVKPMQTEPKHNDVRVVGDQFTGLMWTVQRYCVSNYTQGGKPLVKKGWYELKKENGDTHVFLDRAEAAAAAKKEQADHADD